MCYLKKKENEYIIYLFLNAKTSHAYLEETAENCEYK